MKVPEFLKGVYYGKYQKFVHFFISLVIFLIAQKLFGLEAGLAIAIAIGLLKELFDKFIRKTVFSLPDIAIDILGIFSGLLILILLNLSLANSTSQKLPPPSTNPLTITKTNYKLMQISSPAFQNNQDIPVAYTCDGFNVNPELRFSDIPKDTASLVLLMDDPDIPDFVKEKMNITKFDHWTVFNMPSETTKITRDSTPAGLQGVNSAGQNSYTGPCPPDGKHRYFFKLYAIDNKLNLAAGSTQTQIEQAMQGHILEQAELIGLYERR